MSIGFGLEQITDVGQRNELVSRVMGHLLPTTADTAAPTVTWLRPGDGATVNAADPVEIEVEAVDERGDLKEVRLSIGGTQVAKKVSFPFQMRWQPTADDIGDTVTLSVDAEDKAGNVTTSTRTITVGAASALEESPLPTGVTTVSGKPVVGETLTCVPSGFSGNGVDDHVRLAARRHRDRRRRPRPRTCRSPPTSAATWRAARRRPTAPATRTPRRTR